MDDADQDEKAIHGLMGRIRLKDLAPGCLDNFETEVMKRIAQPTPVIHTGFVITFAVCFGVLMLLGVLLRQQVHRDVLSPEIQRKESSVAVVLEAKNEAAESVSTNRELVQELNQSDSYEDRYARISDNLLVLDLLDEQDVFEDVHLENDLEIIGRRVTAV